MKNIISSALLVLSVNVFAATYYVDATGGNDSNIGSSTGAPWKTLYKVNTASLNPGDNILFKRGEIWRGTLFPKSGSAAGGRVTYSAYGDIFLPKPLILNSVSLNSTSDWTNTTGNIWSTTAEALVDSAHPFMKTELLPNPSFTTDASGWSYYIASPASGTSGRTTSVYDTAPAGYQINCTASGPAWNYIQFYTNVPISISQGKFYLLTFRARATQSFTINSIHLMKNTSPWNGYCSYYVNRTPTIGIDWETHKVIMKANCDAADARVDFGFGASLPASATVYLDSFSFKECSKFDVGNIILNNEESCGAKVWTEDELSVDKSGTTPVWIMEEKQGRFWFDPDNLLVKMYSTSNPATYYESIELALYPPVIEQYIKNYINYENLDLRYTGTHGMSLIWAHNTDIKDCDISFTGGSLYAMYGSIPVRLGNGIEIYGDGHDINVESCNVSDAYDSGITNQGGQNIDQYNIYFRNNVVWNCEYSYEFFLGLGSTAEDIYIENNTLAYAGQGWSHFQRTDCRSGLNVRMGSNLATTSDFYFRNNILVESLSYGFWMTNSFPVNLDYNLYYSSEGNAVKWVGIPYSFEDFSDYQMDTGKDQNSLAQDPDCVDMANLDFHLNSNSPAIDAGTNTGYPYDFNGDSRPVGSYYDIGAYEYNNIFLPEGLVASWQLDEVSSGDVIDSYNHNHGLNNNGTTIGQSGISGYAYRFDGTNDYLSVPVMNYDEITISAWFYKDSNDTVNADAIWGGWYWNSNGQLQEGFELRFYPSNPNQLRFIVVTENSSGTRTTGWSSYVLSNSVGQWYHAVGTYNKTTGVQTLYLNGQAVATTSHSAGNTIVPLTSYSKMKIGYGVNTGYFDGKIDEVRIYRKALTSTEVNSLYQSY